MKVYLAGRFSKRHVLQQIGDVLVAEGHEIVSRWSLRGSDHQIPQGKSKQASDAERRRFAIEDCEDVAKADWVVSLMEEPRNDSRGGRHVEFGFALALGIRNTIIGPRETVFHHLPEVEHFETIDDFLVSLLPSTTASTEQKG